MFKFDMWRRHPRVIHPCHGCKWYEVTRVEGNKGTALIPVCWRVGGFIVLDKCDQYVPNEAEVLRRKKRSTSGTEPEGRHERKRIYQLFG
jgi:hypothetical protein